MGVDITIQGLGRLIDSIACWTIQVVLAVMVLALVFAGIRFFIARGDPGKITEAKKNLSWVLIGIAVIMGTNIIIATISRFISGSDSQYKFIPIDCSGSPAEVNVPNTQQ